MKKIIEVKRLAYREGTSDKVYEVTLTQNWAGGTYSVHYAFGRRGGPQTPGVKVECTDSLPYAMAVFGGLVSSKIKKGYCDVTTPLAPIDVRKVQPVFVDF